MTQGMALFLAFILYIALPAAGIYLGYRGLLKMQRGKMLGYTAMPKLGYMPKNTLPEDIKLTLNDINDKGAKLKLLYGDTNNDGVVDNKDAVNETYVMIVNLLDTHIPEAVADYRRLHDLDAERAKTVKIQNADVTGKQALLDVLNTVNAQFDELLDASYQQDGQKLLIAHRYLKQRFDSQHL